MQLQKLYYWTDAEDKTLWLIADIAWKGMSMQAIADLRFNNAQKNELIMNIPASSVTEFINLTSAIKTYRSKVEVEYEQHLYLAERLIESLNETYDLNQK
jgi:predicted homoserine dehydrogenase-like protein